MNCRNCNLSLEEYATFCLNCGEKLLFRRLTIKAILLRVSGLIAGVDNKVYKTFIDLFKRPEVVIVSYIEGFRKQYVNVISYVGLTLTLIGLQFFILKSYFPELLTFENMQPSGTHGVEQINKILNKIFDYYGFLTVISIPIYAVISKLLFSDFKKYNLAEHIIINAYTLAQTFITFFIFTLICIPFKINYQTISLLSIPFTAIYSYWFFKRLFPEFNAFNVILRVVAFLILATIAVFMLGLFIAFCYGTYMGFTGQMQLPTKVI